MTPSSRRPRSFWLVALIACGAACSAPKRATYAFDVYYDDIVLDTKRVGCLP